MAVYLISYDLHNPVKDYNNLRKSIPTLGQSLQILESVYLVDSQLSAKQINESLQQHMDSDDEIFVVQIKNDLAGRLSNHERFNSWIIGRL